MSERTSVALGTFDGLHVGHTAVLQSALQAAADGSLVPLALLFDRHPLSVLRGEAPPLLLDGDSRDRMLRDMGFALHTVSFAAICGMEPEAFVRDILCGTLHAGAVSCGYNYRFGSRGQGDVALLRTLCAKYGLALHVCQAVQFAGLPVSSTRIRLSLESGDTEAAEAMLGRPFSFSGMICHGNAVGRQYGYPTANQSYPSDLVLPRRGVYKADAQIGAQCYRAITNIGVRPTVSSGAVSSETHILGIGDSDLYGQTMTVSLHRFIRPEQKFASVAEVFRQVRQDIQTAYPDQIGKGSKPI